MTVLKVIDSGSGMALQDYGRPGYQRYGVTEGGVMDRQALAEVNLLCGNDHHTAAIEMIAMGGQFMVAGSPVIVACSGAEMDLKLDGVALPWRSSFVAEPCLLYTSPSPRDATLSRMPSSA